MTVNMHDRNDSEHDSEHARQKWQWTCKVEMTVNMTVFIHDRNDVNMQKTVICRNLINYSKTLWKFNLMTEIWNKQNGKKGNRKNRKYIITGNLKKKKIKINLSFLHSFNSQKLKPTLRTTGKREHFFIIIIYGCVRIFCLYAW